MFTGFEDDYMNDTYVKRFDDLGRIVIPKGIRSKLFGISKNAEGKLMEIIYENGCVILKPVEDENE